jgi:hypothetical protein
MERSLGGFSLSLGTFLRFGFPLTGVNLSIKRVKACDCPGHAEQIHGFLCLGHFGFDCGTFGSPTLRLFRFRYPLRNRLAQVAEAKEAREYRQEEECHRPARGLPSLLPYNAVGPDGFQIARADLPGLRISSAAVDPAARCPYPAGVAAAAAATSAAAATNAAAEEEAAPATAVTTAEVTAADATTASAADMTTTRAAAHVRATHVTPAAAAAAMTATAAAAAAAAATMTAAATAMAATSTAAATTAAR